MKQLDLLRFTIDTLDKLEIQYMIVGSFASGAYGEPRMTQDIDIVINPDDMQLRFLCAAFPPDDFYVSLEAAIQAKQQPSGQFNVLHPESGNKIDFMISQKSPWGREQIARRQKMRLLPDKEGYAARPEDIIISKMRYYEEGGSEKHLRDIAGMLKLSADKIDPAYVERWATSFGLLEIWTAILQRQSKK